MKKMKKHLLLGGAGILVVGVFLLLIVSAAGSAADAAAAVFGGRHVSAKAGNSGEGAGDTVPGTATYVGVDDMDTDFSKKAAAGLSHWENAEPFYSGYAGLCELWVYDVYTAAGLPVYGACCAYSHGAHTARREGRIPKGALIFSGVIPSTGLLYENNHRASAYAIHPNTWKSLGEQLVVIHRTGYLKLRKNFYFKG